MPGKISINGIRIYAYHGCLDEEAAIGGNYIVDVKIFTDYSEAAVKDDLSLTVDYCEVYSIVKSEMAVRSKLIEHAARRIAESLKSEIANVEKVRVKLTKINPPVNGTIDNVSVVYTCS